jgi:hypothetical protein
LHCSLGSLLELISRLQVWQVAYQSGPRVVTTLTSTLLLLLVFHETMAVFQHQCLVYHVLEIPKVSGLHCISQTIIQLIGETILFLPISVHIVQGVARQLGKTSNILIHRHRALLQVLELFLFQLDHGLGNMMSAKAVCNSCQLMLPGSS